MRVAKCGNSLAVRLPAALVEALGLKCAFTTDRSATTTNDKQQGPRLAASVQPSPSNRRMRTRMYGGVAGEAG